MNLILIFIVLVLIYIFLTSKEIKKDTFKIEQTVRHDTGFPSENIKYTITKSPSLLKKKEFNPNNKIAQCNSKNDIPCRIWNVRDAESKCDSLCNKQYPGSNFTGNYTTEFSTPDYIFNTDVIAKCECNLDDVTNNVTNVSTEKMENLMNTKDTKTKDTKTTDTKTKDAQTSQSKLTRDQIEIEKNKIYNRLIFGQ